MQTMSTTAVPTLAARETIGWRDTAVPVKHELYAERVTELRREVQERVNVRLAQGFSTSEALAYAAPQLRAAMRGHALHATCLLELSAQH